MYGTLLQVSGKITLWGAQCFIMINGFNDFIEVQGIVFRKGKQVVSVE